jgi:hypothetical protein
VERCAGPGSEVGGIRWGTATDGEQVYLVETNFGRRPHEPPDGTVIDYSSIAALDAATGAIAWADPATPRWAGPGSSNAAPADLPVSDYPSKLFQHWR